MQYVNNQEEQENQPTLLKDRAWSQIDGELCLVSEFSPMMGSIVKDGEAVSPDRNFPYASMTLECKKHASKIKGFITHKMDFINLWDVFKERGVDESKEEVLIYWTAKHYKFKFLQSFSNFLLALIGSTPFPKLIVAICPKGTYNNRSADFSLSPKHEVMVYVYGLLSIKWWKPEVIE